MIVGPGEDGDKLTDSIYQQSSPHKTLLMDSSVEDANINCRDDNTLVEGDSVAVVTPLNDQKQLALNEVSQSQQRL